LEFSPGLFGLAASQASASTEEEDYAELVDGADTSDYDIFDNIIYAIFGLNLLLILFFSLFIHKQRTSSSRPNTQDFSPVSIFG
jgi:hypothetical protein